MTSNEEMEEEANQVGNSVESYIEKAKQSLLYTLFPGNFVSLCLRGVVETTVTVITVSRLFTSADTLAQLWRVGGVYL